MRDGTSGAYPVFNTTIMIPHQYLEKRRNEGAKVDSRYTELSRRQQQCRHNGSHFRVEGRAQSTYIDPDLVDITTDKRL
jgi:hypothetical protein